MAKRVIVAKSSEGWPGEPVPKERMIALVREKFSLKNLQGNLHFCTEYPNFQRPADRLYVLRIVRYDHVQSPLWLRASYDGVLSERMIQDGDIFLGGYNSASEILDSSTACYGGLSILFTLRHIRLHYCHFERRQPLSNFYYHTSRPAEGILFHLMKMLDILIRDESSPRELLCRSILEMLGRELCHEMEIDEQAKEQPIHAVSRRIKSYLDCNFTDPINCTSVCDALKINRSYGSTIFHADFGISMADYLLKLRVDMAKYLLKSEEKLKVQEIASLCSFQDTGYFIRIFHRMTGKSPGAFRRENSQLQRGSLF